MTSKHSTSAGRRHVPGDGRTCSVGPPCPTTRFGPPRQVCSVGTPCPTVSEPMTLAAKIRRHVLGPPMGCQPCCRHTPRDPVFAPPTFHSAISRLCKVSSPACPTKSNRRSRPTRPQTSPDAPVFRFLRQESACNRLRGTFASSIERICSAGVVIRAGGRRARPRQTAASNSVVISGVDGPRAAPAARTRTVARTATRRGS
jgi:hypothetical protein